MAEEKAGAKKVQKKQAKEERIDKLMGDLRRVSEEMSSGEIPLEEAFLKYKEGMELVERCTKILDRYQIQVDEIKTRQE